MAKLYAELTSDKGGRVVGKGGDSHVNIKLSCGNRILGHVILQHYENGRTYVRFIDSQKPYNVETQNSTMLQITDN